MVPLFSSGVGSHELTRNDWNPLPVKNFVRTPVSKESEWFSLDSSNRDQLS